MKSSWMNAVFMIVLLGVAPSAYADVSEVRIARQYGIAYLPMMMIEENRLLEKHAKAAGLDIKTAWSVFSGGNVMNDALLSGNLHFATGGVTPFITLWAATRGTPSEVKAVMSKVYMPAYLNTRNPAVKTLKDFSEKDKIVVTAVKTSVQSIVMQMEAEKLYGPSDIYHFDRLTVAMSHPDGMAALFNPQSEIDSHFTVPPFQYQELEKPGIHRVMSTYDVTGGPHSFTLVFTTAKFREANPKVYAAFVAAFKEAVDTINRDKKAAAEFYVRVAKDKGGVEPILKMLNDPEIRFDITPKGTQRFAEFMYRIGSIKVKPATWKDMFFPEMHNLPGS